MRKRGSYDFIYAHDLLHIRILVRAHLLICTNELACAHFADSLFCSFSLAYEMQQQPLSRVGSLIMLVYLFSFVGAQHIIRRQREENRAREKKIDY